MKNIAFIPAINGNYTVLVDGVTKTIRPMDSFYRDMVEALHSGDEDKVRTIFNTNLVAVVNNINNSLEEEEIGELKLQYNKKTGDSVVIYNGNVELPSSIANMLIRMWRAGCKEFKHYVKFVENIMSNPVASSRESLFDFLSIQELPITENGTFIAYKGVRSDMYSIRGNRDTRVISGKVDKEGRILNSVGSVIRVVPDDVDKDRSEGCSFGLHVGSYSYADDWSRGDNGVVVAVEVNPAHVVSVPHDCGWQKCRVSEYIVHEVVRGVIKSPDVRIDKHHNVCSNTCAPEDIHRSCYTFTKEMAHALLLNVKTVLLLAHMQNEDSNFPVYVLMEDVLKHHAAVSSPDLEINRSVASIAAVNLASAGLIVTFVNDNPMKAIVASREIGCPISDIVTSNDFVEFKMEDGRSILRARQSEEFESSDEDEDEDNDSDDSIEYDEVDTEDEYYYDDDDDDFSDEDDDDFSEGEDEDDESCDDEDWEDSEENEKEKQQFVDSIRKIATAILNAEDGKSMEVSQLINLVRDKIKKVMAHMKHFGHLYNLLALEDEKLECLIGWSSNILILVDSDEDDGHDIHVAYLI